MPEITDPLKGEDASRSPVAEKKMTSAKMASVYALLSPGSSAEQKFVGLYLIPKILSLEDQAGVLELTDRLPWRFLGQLLKQGTYSSRGNSQRLMNESRLDATMEQSSSIGPIQEPMHTVALHVLEALSQSEICFKNPQFLDLIPLVKPYLQLGYGSLLLCSLVCHR